MTAANRSNNSIGPKTGVNAATAPVTKATGSVQSQGAPTKRPGTRKFPIVGMGASAGGLEALEQFFTHTPSDCGMAFVLVQHLDPSRTSMMAELLQRFT